jgi:hypothetical protein
MSHPLGFQEGSGKFQSTIVKCKHGVYVPFGKGDISSSCDGCNFGIVEGKQSNRGAPNAASADSIE